MYASAEDGERGRRRFVEAFAEDVGDEASFQSCRYKSRCDSCCCATRASPHPYQYVKMHGCSAMPCNVSQGEIAVVAPCRFERRRRARQSSRRWSR